MRPKFTAEQPAILFEDSHLLALQKPSGWFVHPTPLERGAPTVWDWVQANCGFKASPAHRIDRATSGLVLFAKTKLAAQHLAQQFQTHQVEKTYLAWVRGWPESPGCVDSPLKSENGLTPLVSETRYRCLQNIFHRLPFGRYAGSRLSLLELKPLTGRHHQLRRHLAHIRHPILGDATYGDCKLNRHLREHLGFDRLQLFATELSFIHPISGERLCLTSHSQTTSIDLI